MNTALPDSLSDLRIFFSTMKKMQVDGISGFIRLDGREPGPVLGITACTHGNEPSGVAAIKYLLEDFDVAGKLLRGTLYLGINNLDAATRYFEASSDEERKQLRFVDHNMNRLPEDLRDLSGDRRSEIVRARELLPIYGRFQAALDIHSTSQNSDPMIITGGNHFHPELVRGFPIENIISNIDVVQIGLPAFGFFGNKDIQIPVFEIEAGQHEHPHSFERAITCVTSLLSNMGMVSDSGTPPAITTYKEYEIFGSVIFPNNTYKLTRKFDDFEFVKKGTVFAEGAGVALVASQDCHTFFCPAVDTPKRITEEIIFLSEPVRTRKV